MEETKSRTQQDVKAEYTQQACALGEKIHLMGNLQTDIEFHKKRLQELQVEYKALEPAIVPVPQETA
jgi:hypothetical protein